MAAAVLNTVDTFTHSPVDNGSSILRHTVDQFKGLLHEIQARGFLKDALDGAYLLGIYAGDLQRALHPRVNDERVVYQPAFSGVHAPHEEDGV